MQQFQYQIEGPNIPSIYYGIRQEFGVANEYISPNGGTYFFVFESFSFLQNSDMSCTILVDIWSPTSCFLQVVVSGGKSGLFRLDIFGRESSRLSKLEESVQRICHYNQWRMTPFRPAQYQQHVPQQPMQQQQRPPQQAPQQPQQGTTTPPQNQPPS